jgi:hypothetical protein
MDEARSLTTLFDRASAGRLCWDRRFFWSPHHLPQRSCSKRIIAFGSGFILPLTSTKAPPADRKGTLLNMHPLLRVPIRFDP